MSDFVVALPMYDWPETRDQTDAEWTRLRRLLRERGVAAPERLARRNGDLPPVPGGVRDASGALIAPDPAALPTDELDMHALWRHPHLLLAQTCWGPMEQGLNDHVQVVGQPDYSAFEGGRGELYSSAILMCAPRRPSGMAEESGNLSEDGAPRIPVEMLTGVRLAFNSPDSMSGLIALGRDLETAGSGLEIFPQRIETGSHRASALAVAEGRADAAAIDCRTWDMIKRHQPELADRLTVVGWTRLRKGLPLVTARGVPATVVAALRDALAAAGMLAGPSAT